MDNQDLDFKSLFEYSPALCLILLPDFKIVAVSNSYLNATLTKREEIIGKGLFEVFPDNPDDPTADGVSNLRSSLNTVLDTKSAHSMAVQKYDIRREDGTFEVRYWDPLNTPVLDSKKEVKYIIHCVEEVTDFIQMKNEFEERNKINQDLREQVGEMEMQIYKHALDINYSNKKLEEINKELEAFSYSVSHDLRAPLRSINGYASILGEDYAENLDEEAKKMLATICRNAKKMGQLIDDLLAFSRLGRKEITRDEVKMNSLVDKVVTELSQQNENNNVTLKIHSLNTIYGDFNLLKQVWVNLISNAMKYSSKNDKPTIEIGCIESENEITYFVKDNGVGFDMKYYDKLFGVFQRLHRDEEFEGTGVGLAIVQRIINRHGGRVWAKAKLNEGSDFYFTLPKKQ